MISLQQSCESRGAFKNATSKLPSHDSWQLTRRVSMVIVHAFYTGQINKWRIKKATTSKSTLHQLNLPAPSRNNFWKGLTGWIRAIRFEDQAIKPVSNAKHWSFYKPPKHTARSPFPTAHCEHLLKSEPFNLANGCFGKLGSWKNDEKLNIQNLKSANFNSSICLLARKLLEYPPWN